MLNVHVNESYSMTTKRSDQDNLARIVQLLSAQRASDVRNEEIRNFSVMLAILAVVVNMANVYHTQSKVIQFLGEVNKGRTCREVNTVSPWWMAISIQYPLFSKLIYNNSQTPKFIYYLVNLYADTWLTPKMLCGQLINVSVEEVVADWYNESVNPLANVISMDAPIVKDFRDQTSPGPLRMLLSEGFIAFAEANTQSAGHLQSGSYTALWDYCFTESQHEKPPCHKDVSGFWGSVFSNATSGAFLGDMSGGPVGMAVGFVAGGVFGGFLNQDKLQDC